MHSFPDSLMGTHFIKIVLANNQIRDNGINEAENVFSPATPVANWASDTLRWQTIAGVKNYSVWKNGKLMLNTKGTYIPVKASGYAEYQVTAVGVNGFGSFASEPVVVMSRGMEQVFEIENYAGKSTFNYKGYSGDGFVEIGKNINTTVNIPVNIKEDRSLCY